MTSQPAVHGGKVYFVDNSANLHCHDAASGEEHWVTNIGTVGRGSPVVADGKVYVTEVNGFISVAPPANMYDFSFLAPCPSSGLIINGDADRIVPMEDVVKLSDKLKAQKGITITHEVVPGANHFFEKGMDQMIDQVKAYVKRRMVEGGR